MHQGNRPKQDIFDFRLGTGPRGRMDGHGPTRTNTDGLGAGVGVGVGGRSFE